MCHWVKPAYDAAHKNKVFHLCKENHDVPEQVQDTCIDEIKEDDMILSLMGQTRPRATQPTIVDMSMETEEIMDTVERQENMGFSEREM